MAYISFTPVEIWWAWRSVIWCNPSYTPCSSCYWIATWRSDWAQSEFSLASVPTEYHLNLEVLNTKISVIFIQSGKKYCKTLSVCNKLNICMKWRNALPSSVEIMSSTMTGGTGLQCLPSKVRNSITNASFPSSYTRIWKH